MAASTRIVPKLARLTMVFDMNALPQITAKSAIVNEGTNKNFINRIKIK